MAKSAYDLFKEGKDPSEIGNPKLRQELMRLQGQNYQAQLNQVNANYQAWRKDNQGVAIGDYFAGVNAAKKNNYVVKDGDNLASIAKNTGVPEADLLNANPDMRTPQTGMVLNTPQPSSNYFNSEKGLNVAPLPATAPLPGSEAWRAQNVGGLPSNAAYGRTSTNPQGRNGFEGTPVAPSVQRMNQFTQQAQTLNNSFAGLNTLRQTQMGVSLGGQTAFGQIAALRATAGQGLDSLRSAQMGQTPRATDTATAAATTAIPTKKSSYAPRENMVTLLDSITAQTGPAGRIPTDFELKLLIDHARVVPAKQVASSGYSSYGSAYPRYRRGGFGGGGGYGGYNNRYNNRYNKPAFSSSGGFRGLVNWRI
jgi:LysM repeat protein